jgi:hypothetical protein
MNWKFFSITPLLLCSALHAETVKDEYGLVVDAKNTISLFSGSNNIAQRSDIFSSAQSRVLANTSSITKWAINHSETKRVCLEWLYDGHDPRTIGQTQELTQDQGDIEQQRVGRRCLEWVTEPKERYGTAAIYQGKDNVLNKAVVIVQPYVVSLANTTYSDGQFYADINQGQLANSLRNAGYDIVLYRYLRTNAGIAFNAKGLKVLLKRLENTSSVTSTSVIGLSMGGVVARYALTELQKETGLNKIASYVSFDAPHLGANLPRSITDNISRLLDKVDSKLCGLSGKCREARRQLQAILSQMNTRTYKELIINSPSGANDRQTLLRKLASLGHVNTVPSLAITNGAKYKTQGYPNKVLVTHFKLHRKWYNGGSKYFKVYTNPTLDNQSGGYNDFYQVMSDLIADRPHPITAYVTKGQRHAFVSTLSALAGSENNFTEVASYPSNNEQHMTVTYSKALKLRQWLDTHHY